MVGSLADSVEEHHGLDDDRLAERQMMGEAVVEAELKLGFGFRLCRERMVWEGREVWMIRSPWRW